MHAHACTGMWSQHRSSVNVMQMLRLAHPTSRMHARTAVLHVPTRCRPKRYTMHAVYIHTIYIYIHVCVYIYIYTYVHTCEYASTTMHIFIYMQVSEIVRMLNIHMRRGQFTPMGEYAERREASSSNAETLLHAKHQCMPIQTKFPKYKRAVFICVGASVYGI
jgi:hypothetical protein